MKKNFYWNKEEIINELKEICRVKLAEYEQPVEFIIKGKEGNYELIGSSIGGGSIEVTSVNGNAVNFTGAYPTVIVSNRDVPGVLSKVASILYDNDINIAFMKVFRNQKGKNATMVFEVDHEITAEIIGNIKAIEGINKVIMINPIKE